MENIINERTQEPTTSRPEALPTREDYELLRGVVETKGSRCLSRLLGKQPRACGDWIGHTGLCTEALRLRSEAQLWNRDGRPTYVTLQPYESEVTEERWEALVEVLAEAGLQAEVIEDGAWLSPDKVLIEISCR